jgi:hypothetical protein
MPIGCHAVACAEKNGSHQTNPKFSVSEPRLGCMICLELFLSRVRGDTPIFLTAWPLQDISTRRVKDGVL